MASQFSSAFNSLEVVAAEPLYTTREEIESIWSELGVDLRLDDSDDGMLSTVEESYLERAMEEATDEINGYLAGTYLPTVLVGSRRVRRMASYLAAHALAIRRGNPGAFCDRRDEIMATLEQIRAGRLILPNVPKSGEFMPAVINYTVDRRYGRGKLRVDAVEGVDGNIADKREDWASPWGW